MAVSNETSPFFGLGQMYIYRGDNDDVSRVIDVFVTCVVKFEALPGSFK